MILFFTSGTVSYPKMVLHPQSYGLGHVSTARFWHDLRPGDRHWTVTDTGWAKAAWGGLFGQWHERVAIVQVALGKPDADTILSILRDQGITSFCAPPTLYRMLVQADLAALRPLRAAALHERGRAAQPGGHPRVEGRHRRPDGLRRLRPVRDDGARRQLPRRAGAARVDGQAGARAGTSRCSTRRRASARPTTPSATSRSASTDPRPVGLFDGYHRDDDANAASFRGGWYFTGDKAWRDADGYLWFEGRDDDVITSSAYRIGPFEVESALIEHPAVAEAAVVGKDDPQRTQIVTAFVVLAGGYEAGRRARRGAAGAHAAS